VQRHTLYLYCHYQNAFKMWENLSFNYSLHSYNRNSHLNLAKTKLRYNVINVFTQKVLEECCLLAKNTCTHSIQKTIIHILYMDYVWHCWKSSNYRIIKKYVNTKGPRGSIFNVLSYTNWLLMVLTIFTKMLFVSSFR
jgi:hypothetical protein